jgi:primosomal protein N' (replication factor Y)
VRWLVLPFSRSQAIGNGLTYGSNDAKVRPGVLVRMKLRGKATQGIVVAEDNESTLDESKVMPIDAVEHEMPLLPEASLQTLRWMTEKYRTTQRQALTPFLPPPPWHRIFLAEMRDPMTELPLPAAPALTPEQQKAADGILAANDGKPTLLFGVAGSGKTEVYAHLIRTMIASGKQSIMLVPEIFLAEHIIERLLQRLPPDSAVVMHSQLTPTERRKAWLKVRTGEARVVIGPRSALFAPCPDLGLVIMDEEHEWTYKNEQTPRYHARETATELSRNAGAKLVLGTATPSAESWDRVERGVYNVARLGERFGGAEFPAVRIIDLGSVDGKQYPVLHGVARCHPRTPR